MKKRPLPMDQFHGTLANVLHRKTVFAHHDLTRRRGTESTHSYHVARAAHVFAPALGRAGLDRKPRVD
jgi:hypothetical protein